MQPAPNNLKNYYTAYPAPISVIQYLDALFTCEVSAQEWEQEWERAERTHCHQLWRLFTAAC